MKTGLVGRVFRSFGVVAGRFLFRPIASCERLFFSSGLERSKIRSITIFGDTADAAVVRHALSMIGDYDDRALARVERYVRCIVVSPYTLSGYRAGIATAYINRLHWDALTTAVTLLYEASMGHLTQKKLVMKRPCFSGGAEVVRAAMTSAQYFLSWYVSRRDVPQEYAESIFRWTEEVVARAKSRSLASRFRRANHDVHELWTAMNERHQDKE